MVEKYVQFKNTIKNIFQDIILSIKYKPFYRSIMPKIRFVDGFIISLMIMILYLPLRIIIMCLNAKSLSILADKIFWVCQISYFIILILIFLISSFAIRYFFKLEKESFAKWFYLTNLIFIDCFLYMAFSYKNLDGNKTYGLLRWVVLTVSFISPQLKIQSNYKPGATKTKKEAISIFIIAFAITSINYLILYFYESMFKKILSFFK
ncbi:hypothetical protein H312_02777 [Anncaliia algerae PRA339]|uniref:Uncharacterized protein n=1 Tax=Anncaliia algerae PRA339 TaxID=1288291 RepID=A0A059EY33_9MICR|nr:hypothetical protein H312_02777 [Anncaliia algerae PRA339]